MKRLVLIIISCFFTIAGFVQAKVINVKDFGAKGDGKTDDTAAIQKAIDTALKQTSQVKWPVAGGRITKGGPVILFPGGRYVLSDTIELKTSVIKGQGEVSLLMSNKQKNIFTCSRAWQMRIKNLTFVGGKEQLSLGNPNTNEGLINIENCKFYHSSGAAVIGKKGSNSTFLSIKNCIFSKCHQAVVSNCDWTTIRDCWVTSAPGMDKKAVFVNGHGVMTLDNMCGVPLTSGIDQRWIDNYGTLHCINCRFGGEGGGFTPIVNFAKFKAQGSSNSIVIDHCWLLAQSNYKRKCAVYCEEIPNGIDIRNSTIVGIKPIIIAKHINLKTYFKGANQGSF